MRVISYSKQCGCNAGASGPRVILHHQHAADGSVSLSATLVALACTRCDRPWHRMPEVTAQAKTGQADALHVGDSVKEGVQ